jgi:hypothetical protein
MKVNVNKIVRRVNRQLELEAGRVSYNRIHVDKTKYNRKAEKQKWLNNIKQERNEK